MSYAIVRLSDNSIYNIVDSLPPLKSGFSGYLINNNPSPSLIGDTKAVMSYTFSGGQVHQVWTIQPLSTGEIYNQNGLPPRSDEVWHKNGVFGDVDPLKTKILALGDSLTAGADVWFDKMQNLPFWSGISRNWVKIAANGRILGHKGVATAGLNSLRDNLSTIISHSPTGTNSSGVMNKTAAFIWIGTNDSAYRWGGAYGENNSSSSYYNPDLTNATFDGYWAEMEDFIKELKRAKISPIIGITLYRDERFDSTAVNNLDVGKRTREYNQFILDRNDLFDAVVRADLIFGDADAGLMDSDRLHVNDGGHLQLARQCEPAVRFPIQTYRALSPGDFLGSYLTKASFQSHPISSKAPKVVGLTSISHSATTIIDLDKVPNPQIDLTGSCFITVINPRSNGEYTFFIKHDGYGQPTWDTEKIKTRGINVVPSSGNTYDKYKFWSNGTFLYLTEFLADFNPLPPASPGALAEENALQVGSDRGLWGTSFDTLDNIGNKWGMWDGGTPNQYSSGPIRKSNEDVIVGGIGSSTVQYQLNRSDYIIKWKINAKPSFGDFIFMRINSGEDVRSAECLFFNTAGGEFIACPNGINGFGTRVNLYTFSYVAGDTLEFRLSGSNIGLYKNNMLQTNVTSSVGQTKSGIGLQMEPGQGGKIKKITILPIS